MTTEAESQAEKTLKERAAELLSGLTARLTAATLKEERDAAWGTIQAPDTLAMLASAWSEDEDHVKSHLNVIELIQGNSQGS